MKYFAYGSNMSISRLRERVPSAVRLGIFFLEGHRLCFHKASEDGSAKCDAYQTNNPNDEVIGALFDIDKNEKHILDQIEGLGHGYNEKIVQVTNQDGLKFSAFTYFAIKIEAALKPYSWYMNHVVTGAKEIQVPKQYLEEILSLECVEDPVQERDEKERVIYSNQ